MIWLAAVPAWCWWLIALLLVAGGQQYRVVVAQGDTETARSDLADYRLEVSERDRRAAAQVRSEEQRRQAVADKEGESARRKLNWPKAVPLMLNLLLAGCAGKSNDCAPAEQQPAVSSLPSSARQEPLPSWCSGIA